MSETQVARAGSFDDIPIYALADGSRGAFTRFYEHTQNSASSTWTISHNLGRVPSVTLVDGTGSEMESTVTHIDENTAVVTFSQPESGKAYLKG